jgi:hypothetical protein
MTLLSRDKQTVKSEVAEGPKEVGTPSAQEALQKLSQQSFFSKMLLSPQVNSVPVSSDPPPSNPEIVKPSL